jgi:hypothetical protein
MLWAQHHFEVMKRHSLRYVRGNCAEFVIQRNSASGEQAWGRFRGKNPLPQYIPLMVGDCIQSAHSCLDYLACKLVSSGEESSKSKNAFPIVDSPAQFNEAIGKHILKGVPFAAVAVVESLQPYNRTGDPHKSGLWILKTLANMHKHRDILLSVLGAAYASDDAEVFERNGDLFTFSAPDTLDLDAEFGPFPVFEGKVKMDRKILLDIVFEQEPFRGQRMQTLVTQACLAVREDVLPKFEKFFS